MGEADMARFPRLARTKESIMRRTCLCFLILTTAGLAVVPSSPKAPAVAAAAPTSGFRAEFLEVIAYYEQRYTRLAEAMPAEKYTWRPGEGVRSIGEVFTHITAANYGVARALGTAIPNRRRSQGNSGAFWR